MAASEPIQDDVSSRAGRYIRTTSPKEPAVVLNEAITRQGDSLESVRSPHIFMGLLLNPDPGVKAWGDRLGADLGKILGQFQELFHQEEGDEAALLLLHREFLSSNVIRVLRDSYQRAVDHNRPTITPMDLLITLLTSSNSIVAECLNAAASPQPS